MRDALASSMVSEVAEEAGETSGERMMAETRHLIGREAWLAGIQQMVRGFPAKKLLILQGPVGIGKSSELTRLAQAFQSSEPTQHRVIWLPLPTGEWSSNGPEAAFDVLLATLLSKCSLAPLPAEAPRERLIAALLTHLEQGTWPTVILLDNAGCLLEEGGSLAACWEGFLTQFVRSRHEASLLLATKEWHGWPGRETIFVAETFVPPLTQQESVRLLQRLGLQEVPVENLEAVSTRVSGIPLLLEWTAKLVADPLLLDRWESFHEQESLLAPSYAQEQLARRLQHVIEDPSLLGEHLANKLTPLLLRIINRHLSQEARLVLQRLSLWYPSRWANPPCKSSVPVPACSKNCVTPPCWPPTRTASRCYRWWPKPCANSSHQSNVSSEKRP